MWGVLAYYTTSVLFYLSDLIQKKASHGDHGWRFIFVRSRFTFGVTFIIAWLMGEDLASVTIAEVLHILGSCVICTFGLYYFLKAIHSGHFANVGALSLVGNPLQWAVGLIIFGNKLFVWDIPIMLLLASGSVLQCSFKASRSAAKWVILSSFFWTIGYAWLSHAVQHFPLSWSVAFMEGVVLTASGFMTLFNRGETRQRVVYSIQWTAMMLLLGVIIFGASYFNHYAYRENELALVSMLHLTTFPLYYLISMRIFREKPGKKEWFAFCTGIIGLMGMTIRSFMV